MGGESGRSGIPSAACTTGMAVHRESTSTSWLGIPGARCMITTKPSWQSSGIARKNVSSASTPPAEAPMPTMGKRASDRSGAAPGFAFFGFNLPLEGARLAIGKI